MSCDPHDSDSDLHYPRLMVKSKLANLYVEEFSRGAHRLCLYKKGSGYDEVSRVPTCTKIFGLWGFFCI